MKIALRVFAEIESNDGIRIASQVQVDYLNFELTQLSHPELIVKARIDSSTVWNPVSQHWIKVTVSAVFHFFSNFEKWPAEVEKRLPGFIARCRPCGAPKMVGAYICGVSICRRRAGSSAR